MYTINTTTLIITRTHKEDMKETNKTINIHIINNTILYININNKSYDINRH